jgi:signal transduction histidine kinase/ActR/RegA family two-component response regulator
VNAPHHIYDSSLVGLSVLVAILAAYSALDLSGRIRAATGRARVLWLIGGATAMGFGIWTMHFVGMLASQLTRAATHAALPLLASFVVAVGASAFALSVASRARLGSAQLSTAAVAMGIAIAGMHFIAMAGMRVASRIQYDPLLVGLSIAIAIGASFVALFIARRLRDEESPRIRGLRTMAAIVMGLAIAGMHYTAMAAARFPAIVRPEVVGAGDLSPIALGFAIAFVGIVVAGLALIAAMLDRLFRSRLVADRLRAEKEAAEGTIRLKNEFLANMSHELRTPLNSIIGFANILLKNKSEALGQQEIHYVSRIAANGAHLLKLINGVLDVSKLEAGRMDVELSAVDLDLIVRETIVELEGEAAAREVRVTAELPSHVALLETDRGRFKQILTNLVGNAVKFTRRADVIVRVHADASTGEATRIDVIDRGIGIPADRLHTIFEAFQQADTTTAREYGGTGLGLTITRALAQLLGWTIDVSSTVGVGSTFSIVMSPGPAGRPTERSAPPMSEPASARHVTPPDVPVAAPGRVRVLLIDDEQDARTLLQHQLEELGCEVTAAASFDEGMRLARLVRPDLITLDIVMSSKDGMDALLELKTDVALQDIPVVMVSVIAGEQQRRFVGAADWIDKPVTREALMQVIARNLSDGSRTFMRTQ